MILIAVVDDHMGMCFNQRRLSRDRVLSDKILDLTDGKILWMNPYSEKLFGPVHSQINIDDNFLREAAQGEYCFVETEDPATAKDWIEQIILFKWNRRYPADIFFSIDLNKWELKHTEDFAGNSHAKITMEVYDVKK